MRNARGLGRASTAAAVIAFAALGVAAAGAGASVPTLKSVPAQGQRAVPQAPPIVRGPAISPSQFPHDPGFAPCESQNPSAGCGDSDEWKLFGPLTGNTCIGADGIPGQPHPDGGLPCWATNATDPDSSAGVDETGAWAQGNMGRPDVRIAYIEGGVNYSDDGIKDALDNIYLNKGELPYPEGPNGKTRGSYDYNGDGHFDIRDYAQDPRVNPACPAGTPPFTLSQEGTTRGCVTGGQHQYLNQVDIGGVKTAYLSPEDLIAVFGHCKIVNHQLGACPPGGKFDNDGNGYPNDISGWNTERNNNDPQTEDLAYSHAPGLIGNLVGVANNNFGSVGECPDCEVIPIKQGAEAVGRSDQWAEAILYATDAGASVISSVVVEYTYSSFAKEAVAYANQHGVLLSFDSNDFDSADHSDGMLYNNVIPGTSLTENEPAGKGTQWFRARSNVTSYGPHNIFSGYGNSTSSATPFMAAMMAMVQSAALNARDQHLIPRQLTPNEVKQVMMDTVSPVIPQTQAPNVANQWPGNPNSATDKDHTNWSTQYGYGRPDLGAATHLVMSGFVPPTAEIDSPDWYAYVDPSTQHTLQIKGSVAPSAWRSGGVQWTLEWALGADPADSDFHTISTGHGAKSGVLGTLDTSQLQAFAGKAPSNTEPPTGQDQYTVTLRLRVVDGNGLKAEDRRVFNARHDPNLVSGFPKSIGTEISGAPTYADLEGNGQQDLVYGTYDGVVNALRPNGSEVPGFPVQTQSLASIDPNDPENYNAQSYRTDRQLRGASDPVSGIAIGDLNGDGQQDIIATTSNAFVYAWSPHGRLLPGFPNHSLEQFWTLPVPTPRASTPHSRLASRGNFSPPVLADLQGNGKLDILMSAYDGFEYAFQPDGQAVPGWPVQVQLPGSMVPTNPTDYIHDTKLIFAPSAADVLKTGTPQVFVPSSECVADSSGQQHPFMYGIWPDGNLHPGGPFMPGWPVALPSLAGCYDLSIDFVEEGAAPASIADFDNSGTLRIATAGVTGPPVILNGDGTVFRTLLPACTTSACLPKPPFYPGDPLTVELTGQGGVGDLTGTGTPNYVLSNTGASSIAEFNNDKGNEHLPQTYEQAFDVSTGSPLASFPRAQDGFPFFDAAIVGNLDGSSQQAVIESNDSGWIHAFEPSGGEAPGFPKFTGQWPSFSGVLAPAGPGGQQRLAYGTREGSLFVWNMGGTAAKDSWPHFKGDIHNDGTLSG